MCNYAKIVVNYLLHVVPFCWILYIPTMDPNWIQHLKSNRTSMLLVIRSVESWDGNEHSKWSQDVSRGPRDLG